jgi:hypothetical protein
MLFHLPLAFPQIEFRTRTRTMRWDLLLPANTKFRGQVYPMIPLALSTACYKIVKIRSSDKTSNPNSRILNSEGSKPFLGGGKSSQINIPLTLGCQSVG